MLDIRLDATESVKDITYGGRIDSLDLDVNSTPAILECEHFIVRSSPANGSAVSIAPPPRVNGWEQAPVPSKTRVQRGTIAIPTPMAY